MVRFVFVILTLGFVPNVSANQTWDTSTQCTEAIGDNFPLGSSTNREFFIYVQSDFAARMRSCNPTNIDPSVSEFEVRALIESTLEAWNQQTRAVSFHFGGVVDADSITEACNSGLMTKGPALFIKFHEGCKDISGSCASNNAVATAWDTVSSTCGGVSIWGDTNTLNSCTGTGVSDFLIGPTSATTGIDLKSLLLHELGHHQNLGHFDDAGIAVTTAAQHTTGRYSGMWSGIGGYDGMRHIRTWEKDCSIEVHRERDVEYNLAWARAGDDYWATSTHSQGTVRGFISGGSARDDPNGNNNSNPQIVYGLYTDYWLDWGIANSVGSSMSFSSWKTLDSDLRYLHVSPTITFVDNYTNGSRMLASVEFTGSYDASGVPIVNDPPQLLRGYSSSLFDGTSVNGSIKLSECNNLACSSSSRVTSHLPLATAYDPVSDRHIVAHVDTSYNTGTDFNNGLIHVAPGYYNITKLRESSILNVTETTNPPNESDPVFSYQMATEHPVGVACTDDISTYPFNCLLAWVDRGMLNGRVVYTYFKVDSNGEIDWKGAAYARGGSETNSGVQAAYTWGRFRMAWKKRFGADKVEYTYSMGGYTSWSSPTEMAAPGIVDIPTYLYHINAGLYGVDRNHAIIWTESDISDN